MDITMESYFMALNKRFKAQECENVCVMLEQRIESCDEDARSYVCSFPVMKWMGNPSLYLHGGICATMFDQAMGLFSMYHADGRKTPTIDIKVSFCRPVPMGKRIFMRTRLLCRGRTLVQTAADAWLEGEPDVIVASASAAYHIIQ